MAKSDVFQDEEFEVSLDDQATDKREGKNTKEIMRDY